MTGSTGHTCRLAACVLAVAVFARPGGAVEQTSKPSKPSGTKNVQQASESKAHAALAAGKPELVLSLLEERTIELPAAERHYLAGRAHFELGHFSEARRELGTTVQMRRNDADACYWLGRALAAGSAPALAVSRFEQANWLGLDSPELHYHWALAHRAAGNLLGKVERAAWPRTGKIAVPGEFVAGGVIVSAGSSRAGMVSISPPHSALYHAVKAANGDDDRGEYHALCAEIWASVRRNRKAVGSYQKASSRLKGEALLHCYEGWAASLLALGDFEGFLARTREGMLLKGPLDMDRLAAAYDRVAAESSARGELRRQITYLTLGVEMRPTARRRLALADALLEANQAGDAVSHLQAALEDNPPTELRQRIHQRLQRATYLASPR